MKQLFLVFVFIVPSTVCLCNREYIPCRDLLNVSKLLSKPFASRISDDVFCLAYDGEGKARFSTVRDITRFEHISSSALIVSRHLQQSPSVSLDDGGLAVGWIDTLAVSVNSSDWDVYTIRTGMCDSCEVNFAHVNHLGDGRIGFTAQEYIVTSRDTIGGVPTIEREMVAAIVGLFEKGTTTVLVRDTINKERLYTNMVMLDDKRLVVGHSPDVDNNVMTFLNTDGSSTHISKPFDLVDVGIPTYSHVTKTGTLYTFYRSNRKTRDKDTCSAVTYDPKSSLTSVLRFDGVIDVNDVVDIDSGIACAARDQVMVLRGSQRATFWMYTPDTGYPDDALGLYINSAGRVVVHMNVGIIVLDPSNWQTSMLEEPLPIGSLSWYLCALDGSILANGSGDHLSIDRSISDQDFSNGTYFLFATNQSGVVFRRVYHISQ